MIKTRYLEPIITNIAFPQHKMAFISGPRQCGKTTMAKQLLKQRKIGEYYNWDNKNFRKQWAKNPQQIIPTTATEKTPLIILDEIHKAKLWKRDLKGLYDTLENNIDIIVTGSTKLNTYRKGSDSLQGRYYHFRLHPFSLAELESSHSTTTPQQLLTHLLENPVFANQTTINHFKMLDKFGPFPEPLLQGSEQILNLWQHGRIEKIIREDLRDISRIPELSQIEMLTALLPDRAANILSIQSLCEDLEVAYTTVQRWIKYLNELYYCYELKPYAKSLARAIKKERKLYLWDWSEVDNEAARYENMAASHILKYCDYLTETGQGNYELRYIRDKTKKELDFVILKKNRPWLAIEAKLNNDTLSENWRHFLPKLSISCAIQIVKKSGIYKKIHTEYGEILIISADAFFSLLV